MRNLNSAAIGVVLAALCSQAMALEATWEYAVQVSAKVDSNPARITLSWPLDSQAPAQAYSVYRKTANASEWGNGSMLAGNASSYVDTNVTVGCAHEYQIVKSATAYTGYGYIYAGIQAPLIENHGKLLLLVDETFSTSLGPELSRLEEDMVSDGWVVIRRNVARNDSPTNIKAQIKREYAADPANLKALFLFGHVPVAYSGNIVPDGHYPDHQGAWPCDAYYADMDGIWTDTTVNSMAATDSRNRNVPGDGKFDQSEMPSLVELQVGRVDLANLPGKTSYDGPATFRSELDLLRNYLNKDHNWRHKRVTVPARAVIYDDFGIRGGEAFAASAYRNFAPLVSAANITTLTNQGTWIPALQTNHYLWAYGCGAGSYTSIGGLGATGTYKDGTTIEMVTADIKAAFTMVMGSWLADWDSEDNFMRAILAAPSEALSCSWSGRPHWYYHHMGLGLPLGHAARLAQNNGSLGTYRTHVNSAATQVHIALMGDPTLRLHPVAPPSNVAASISGGAIALKWSASPESGAKYHLYRASTAAGPFERVTRTLLTGTSFTGASSSTPATYMVRAVKLETTPSGSYYNPSQGIFASVAGAAELLAAATNSPLTVPAPAASAVAPLTPTGTNSRPSSSVREAPIDRAPQARPAASTGVVAPAAVAALPAFTGVPIDLQASIPSSLGPKP